MAEWWNRQTRRSQKAVPFGRAGSSPASATIHPLIPARIGLSEGVTVGAQQTEIFQAVISVQSVDVIQVERKLLPSPIPQQPCPDQPGSVPIGRILDQDLGQRDFWGE